MILHGMSEKIAGMKRADRTVRNWFPACLSCGKGRTGTCWNRTFTVPHPITRYLYLFVYIPYLATVVRFSPFFLSRTVDVDAVLPLWGTENLTAQCEH